jgi:hypothetical protein
MVTLSDPQIARRTWMTLEPIHGMVYFTPHGTPIYDAIGLTGRQHYFASRAAAFGRVSPEVITSTFFNFSPALVRSAMTTVWDRVTPEDVLAARLRVVDVSLRAAAPDLIGSDATKRAAELATNAACSACERVDGKPLFAAHASLTWPTEPHLVLWHAQTLLREYRGDLHIALLLAEGFSGLDALITHGATGAVPLAMLQQLRGWSDGEWNAGVESLRSRGIITPGEVALTETGVAMRQRVEDRTDQLSAAAWAVLGDDGCRELRASARPLSAAVIDAGWSPLRKLPPGDD